MEATAKNLWNKNFLLYIIGMEFNLIGTNLLKFVLPFYVLLETGDPALMGTILAFSTIPLALFIPIGGVAADRFSKKNIMVLMNFASAIAIMVYLGMSGIVEIVPATIIFFLLFSSFESMLSPTSEASVPFLVPKDDLVRANSVTWILAIFSTVGSPIIGGFILARFGLTSALCISIVLYALATVVKLMMRIPFTKQKTNKSLSKTIISDIKEGTHFAIKEHKIGKILLASIFIGLFLIPLSSVALPVLVSIHLGMEETFVGLANGIVAFGGTASILLLGLLRERVNIAKTRSIFMICSLAIIPAGLGVLWIADTTLVFIALIASFFIADGLSTMVVVLASSYIGEKTPEYMIGKVMSLYIAAIYIGSVVGNYIFGILFRNFIDTLGILLLIIAGFSIAYSLLFLRIKE